MNGMKDYHGNCHCGLFRFKITVPEFTTVTICKCSFCLKKGITWAFPLPANAITIESTEEHLTLYQFAIKQNEFYFCNVCGSFVLCKNKVKGSGVNARMLQSVDLDALEVEEDLGALTPPAYGPPPFPDTKALGEAGNGEEFYFGNCHCKMVKYAVKTKSLDTQEVLSCNCSLCSRNGDLYIYPTASSVILEGDENLTDYPFLDKKSLHTFCKTCGVTVSVRVLHEGQDLMPLNVRTIHDIDLDVLKYKKYNGAGNKPEYKGVKHVPKE